MSSGKKMKPGAFGITTIWNADAQTEEIRAMTRDIATQMLHMEGFIGVSFFRIGGRGVTISAWEKPEHTKQLIRGGNTFGSDAKVLGRIGRFWPLRAYGFPITSIHSGSRCAVCRKMNDYHKDSGVCSCGQPLPEAPSYF